MRLRKEIESGTCYSSNNGITINQNLIIEMLLDIRDQNEEIINQLRLIKTWSSKY